MRPQTLDQLSDEFTQDEISHLNKLGAATLRGFNTFEMDDLVKHGQACSFTLNRQKIERWAKVWIDTMKQAGAIEQVNLVSDAPTYIVRTLPATVVMNPLDLAMVA